MENKNKNVFAGKKIWMYWPGENACLFDENYKEGMMVCSPKQGEIGDMNEIMSVRGGLDAALKAEYGTYAAGSGARKLLNEFCNVMKVGDFVLARSGFDYIVGIGIVTSDYFYDDNRPFFKHCRKVNWIKRGKWPIDDFFKTRSKWHRVTMIDQQYRQIAESIITALCRDKI